MKNIHTDYKIALSKNFFLSFAVILIGLCYFLFLDFSVKTFAYDEIFSIAMIKYSFSDIWQITSTDVHPPLYYIMLKAFVLVFGNHDIVYRIFSALGIISLLFVGLIWVRKYFGEKISLLFIIIIVMLPVSQYLVTEVRMYSWALIFVFVTALSVYRLAIRGKLVNYITLLIFSLCAAYTHYFALLGVLVIFIISFSWLLYSKKKIAGIIIVFLLFIAGYSFWIPELYVQISRVNLQYWINKPGLKDLLLLTYYCFSPKEPSHPYIIFNIETMSIALSIMLLLICTIFWYAIRFYKKSTCRNITLGFVFIIVAISPILLSILYSYLVKPILVPRYITCYLGCLVLGFSMILVQMYSKSRVLNVIIISSLSLLLLFSVVRLISEKKYNDLQYLQLTELKLFLKDRASQKTTFLAPFHSSIELSKLEFLYPDNLYLFYSRVKTNYTTRPFSYIEVNNLPEDFDFYLVVGNNHYTTQIDDTNRFFESIKGDYIKGDSLIQKDKKIYRMNTIHRDREIVK